MSPLLVQFCAPLLVQSQGRSKYHVTYVHVHCASIHQVYYEVTTFTTQTFTSYQQLPTSKLPLTTDVG